MTRIHVGALEMCVDCCDVVAVAVAVAHFVVSTVVIDIGALGPLNYSGMLSSSSHRW